MSVPFNCKCAERSKPINERRWIVLQRYCNHSAFNGHRYTPSDYSTVQCLSCRAIGRTKAGYVAELPDGVLTPGSPPVFNPDLRYINQKK